ncbi:MAG: TRAP transporter small permease subunit [Saprospiraceae bacterium]|nr:TRAP transporter small permease subunit [Saprospiraceae bacterium]
MEKAIARLLKYGTLISTYALIGSVLLQIFARFFLANTPPWTEEASRLFFIYATAFGAGLAFKSQYYVHLDVFYNKLSPKIQHGLNVFIPLLVLILFGLLTIHAIQFIRLGHYEFSPSMKMRMSIAFLSMFVLGASISYYAARDLFKALKRQAI